MTLTLQYAPHKDCALDVYPHPVRVPGGNPVVIYVHGGGWLSGDKANFDQGIENDFVTHVQAQSAFPIDFVAINYRMARRAVGTQSAPHFWPTPWNDVARAIAFVRENRGRLEFSQTLAPILWGYSAGAHMSMFHALSLGRQEIRAVLNHDGVLALDDVHWPWPPHGIGQRWATAPMGIHDETSWSAQPAWIKRLTNIPGLIEEGRQIDVYSIYDSPNVSPGPPWADLHDTGQGFFLDGYLDEHTLRVGWTPAVTTDVLAWLQSRWS